MVDYVVRMDIRSAYGASKHALQAFSDSLRAEVKEHNLSVTVINPGYIRTSISVNALKGDGNKNGRSDESIESGADPYKSAQQIVRAVKIKKEEVLLCSFIYKIAVLIRAFFPKVFFLLMERRAAKARKDD